MGHTYVADSLSILKRINEASRDASKKAGLEENTEKTKYISMVFNQNAERNHNLKIAH